MKFAKARDGTTDQQLADAFEPDDQPVLEALSAKLEGDTVRQKNPHPKVRSPLRSVGYRPARRLDRILWQGRAEGNAPRIEDDFRRIKFGTMLRLEDV